MATHSPNNERIKRRYFSYLRNAKQHSEATVDAVAKALDRFEDYTKYRDFKAFHYEQAIAFKTALAQQDRSGPTRLDSTRGVYKCNPGELRVIHGGARVAHATHTSARRGG